MPMLNHIFLLILILNNRESPYSDNYIRKQKPPADSANARIASRLSKKPLNAKWVWFGLIYSYFSSINLVVIKGRVVFAG